MYQQEAKPTHVRTPDFVQIANLRPYLPRGEACLDSQKTPISCHFSDKIEIVKQAMNEGGVLT